MTRSHLTLFLASRAISAAGNLVSVAVFTRFIGPGEYGAYILMFAWAIIVYGFSAQWMKFAYFGVYRAAQAGAIISSYARLVMGAILIASLVLVLAGAVTPLGMDFALALLALFAGMTIYEAAIEVSRTRLQAGTVALGMICRAVFVLSLGVLTLSVYPSAVALAFAVAAGHLLAAAPSFVMLRGFRGAAASRAAAAGLVRYGWPLIFSFGVFAIGQTVDRLLIAYYAGNEVLGPYGVVADLMRQSYMVVGESIALALITVAKQQADEGDRARSDRTMGHAFTACMVAASFGAAFFMVFGHDLARLLLGADFAEPAYEIIPYFALAFGFMTLRSFYFGQVIYFGNATFLELLTAVVLVLVSALLAVLLVPAHGAAGGAMALMVAHGAACLVAAVLGRRLHALPVDLKALTGIPALAAALVGACLLAEGLTLSGPALLAVQAGLFAAAVLVTAYLFDLAALLRGGSGRAAHGE